MRDAMLTVFYSIAIIAWIAFFVVHVIRKNSKSNAAIIDEFVERERSANSARRKDIDETLFFTPNLDALPRGDAESRAYKRVLETSERKMLRFERPVTNTELKLAYGPSQIEDIAWMEENYQEYIRALIYWAEELNENGNKDGALNVLEYALEQGADFKRGYTLAADIYAERGDTWNLKKLTALAEGRTFTDESVKRGVVGYITSLIYKGTEQAQ